MKRKFNIENAGVFEREKYYKLNLKFFMFVSFLLFSVIISIIGFSMNMIVVAENDCKMPVFDFTGHNIIVSTPEIHEFYSIEEKEKINFFYLSDIIHLKNAYWSIGDFIQFASFPFIAVFFFLMLYFLIKLYIFEKKLKK